MKWTITGYSTALFSTWYNIEELGLLFDAGDGLTAGLLQKARKIKHIFISHADRDHVTGLLALNQLNARDGFPKIYYPRDSGSFPYLADFCRRFDPHISGSEWIGIEAGQEIEIKKGFIVQAFRNEHISIKDQTKSLSFKVFQTKQKLKPEFQNLLGKEIKQLRQAKGINALTNEVRTCLLGYSGDTPITTDGRWNNAKILIHESTFLERGTISDTKPNRHQHSYLEEVLEMVAGSNIEQLILGHFSSRYKHAEILKKVKEGCLKYGITIPVHCVLPSQKRQYTLSLKP